jgi:hypothetical protein
MYVHVLPIHNRGIVSDSFSPTEIVIVDIPEETAGCNATSFHQPIVHISIRGNEGIYFGDSIDVDFNFEETVCVHVVLVVETDD